MGVALSFAGVSLGNNDFCFGGDAGVVETQFGGFSLAGVAGGFIPVFPSMLEKSLPKKEPLAGAAGFAGSSLAVPSLAKVVPSLKPPARPNKPWDG